MASDPHVSAPTSARVPRGVSADRRRMLAGAGAAVVGVLVARPDAASAAAPSTSVPLVGTALLVLSRPGLLTVSAGRVPVPVPRDLTVVSVRAMLGTAPAGQAVVIDVLCNGTSLWLDPATRPTVAAGTTDSGAGTPPDRSLVPAGSLLTLDVVQIGSTAQGSDLGVTVEYQ